eukprot:1345949-Amorphochlora_amoeboformis.AAC.1
MKPGKVGSVAEEGGLPGKLSMATHAIHSVFKGVAEYFTPVLKDSNFKENFGLPKVVEPGLRRYPHSEGRVNPGGSILTFSAVTRAPGKPGLVKPYLPERKQFLITRNVPSLKRANDYALSDAKEAIVEDAKDGEGWVSTHVKAKVPAGFILALFPTGERAKYVGFNRPEEEKETIANAEDEKKIADAEDEKKKKTSTAVEEKKREEEAEEENEDDIPDMDEFEDDNLVEA